MLYQLLRCKIRTTFNVRKTTKARIRKQGGNHQICCTCGITVLSCRITNMILKYVTRGHDTVSSTHCSAVVATCNMALCIGIVQLFCKHSARQKSALPTLAQFVLQLIDRHHHPLVRGRQSGARAAHNAELQKDVVVEHGNFPRCVRRSKTCSPVKIAWRGFTSTCISTSPVFELQRLARPCVSNRHQALRGSWHALQSQSASA